MNSDLKQSIAKVLSDDSDVRDATVSHQAEFPYHREAEAQITRREFCNFLFLTSGALLAATAGFAAKATYDAGIARTYMPLRIDGAGALEPNSALNFTFPGKDDLAILVRAEDGHYHAFDQKCTHLTCPVYYSKEHKRLECPCHEGGFNATTGAVLYGPPPRPLDRIELEIHAGEIFAVGVRKGAGHGHT